MKVEHPARTRRARGPERKPTDHHGSASQRGAAIVILAFCGVGLTAATIMAADAGMMYYERTRMQAASDAAALAGASALASSTTKATKAAVELGRANGFDIAPGDVTFPAGKRCQVNIQARKPLFLGDLLKMDAPNIAAASTAELTGNSTGKGPRPFGIPNVDLVLGKCINSEREYVLKAGAGRGSRGNFQALALDGPGTNDYVDAIMGGAKRAIAVGDVLETKPGNMTGPTVESINRLIAGDYTRYDEAARNPEKTRRVITVPIIAPRSFEEAKGRSVVRVTGIAHFYVTYTTRKGEVFGRFIGSATDQKAEGATRYAVRLVD